MEKGLEIWVFGDHRHHPQDRLTLQVLGEREPFPETGEG